MKNRQGPPRGGRPRAGSGDKFDKFNKSGKNFQKRAPLGGRKDMLKAKRTGNMI